MKPSIFTPDLSTTVEEGFAFLGFEFRKAPARLLYMWPRKKACQHIRGRVREVVRSFPRSASIGEVIRKLNPILNGWCTYFRAGNSNRIFHKIDWAVLIELQLWLRRKHQCSWPSARKRSNYHFLYKRGRLYQMVGRITHLPRSRSTWSNALMYLTGSTCGLVRRFGGACTMIALVHQEIEC